MVPPAPRKRKQKTVRTATTAVLLTTNEVATLLGVHPKHVYRLLKRGLPARRVGDEWRYDEAEVLGWTRTTGDEDAGPESLESPPPLLAANGDLAVEALFEALGMSSGPTFGFVLSDHATGLERLRDGSVLLAGCHGDEPPSLGDDKIARIYLADRELGFAHRRGFVIRGISSIVGHRLASRPKTAGIRQHLDRALEGEGIAFQDVYCRAEEYASHRDAVMAVVRGSADIALSSRAWAAHAGLGFTPHATEPYGMVFRAKHLADPRILQLCEIVQGSLFRDRLSRHAGYGTSHIGQVSIGSSLKHSNKPTPITLIRRPRLSTNATSATVKDDREL